MRTNEKQVSQIIREEIKKTLKENSNYSWSIPIEQWDKFDKENFISDMKSLLNMKSMKTTMKEDENSVTITGILTNPRDLGPMGQMIEKLTMTVVILCADRKERKEFNANVEWKYMHPNGRSNGFNLRYMRTRDGKIIVVF